jgi:hypothetical protein
MFIASDTFRVSWLRSCLALVGLIALAAWCAASPAAASPAKDSTVDELKARLVSAPAGDRPRLCIEIAERQLGSANKLYADGLSEKGEAALTDVAVFAESARDNSIQSNKHLKQTEIAVRMMAHKLNDLKHTVTHDEQSAVQNTIDRLQRVRDDLLAAMFHKGGQ